MVHRAGYMREYYKKNRLRILKERKKKYDSDTKWAEEQKRKRRELRKRQRALKKHQEAEYRKVHGNKPKGRLMRVIHPEDDTKSAICTMYTMTEVSKILKINGTQLKSWIHLDRIPHPQYRTGNNYRLYTSYETHFLLAIVRRHRTLLSKDYLKLRINDLMEREIKEAFTTLLGGIPPEEYERDNDE